jgi:hypothetical protein
MLAKIGHGLSLASNPMGECLHPTIVRQHTRPTDDMNLARRQIPFLGENATQSAPGHYVMDHNSATKRNPEPVNSRSEGHVDCPEAQSLRNIGGQTQSFESGLPSPFRRIIPSRRAIVQNRQTRQQTNVCQWMSIKQESRCRDRENELFEKYPLR